mmetsp:Transcript_92001/g.297754  ORF Transcript_92001/g.297754 Transcript_92001/m.297754 type:complete len:239 (+) Transcript_92001:332-1048(+)
MPPVMTSSAPSRRSRQLFTCSERSPAASYGTPSKARSSSPRPTRAGGTKNSPSGHAGGTSNASSAASAAQTSSQRPKSRSVASSSCAVRCNPTMTAPSFPASPRAARRARSCTRLSAFMPQSDVPKAMTRSALSCCSRSSERRSVRSSPVMGTTGLSGACHAPWISLMHSCGSPAFCGSPSWFWFTQCRTRPARCRATSARCASVGCAQKGERKAEGAAPGRPGSPGPPLTLASERVA